MSRKPTAADRAIAAAVLTHLLDAMLDESIEADRETAASLIGALATLPSADRTEKDQLLYAGAVRETDQPLRVLGYVRVSTDEQAASGLGLAAQRKAIRDEADRRGWNVLAIVGESAGASSATLDRNGLTSALDRLDHGEADVLLVSKLDRLSRSVAQGAQVMDRAKRKGWSLVALDFGLDTTTPAGEMVANVVLSTAQYERRMTGLRTRDALAEKRAQGVRLGRPPALDEVLVERIGAMRAEGKSMRNIAATLNAEAVPTGHGGKAWHASTVKNVLDRTRAALAAIAREN